MTRLDALLAHPDILRLSASLRERPGRAEVRDGPVRWAAIAIVLRAGEADHPEMLMIKRADHEGDPWSGHVACPGGRAEPMDRDLEATAIRETWEETGIDIAREGRILGRLDDLSPRTPYLPPIVIRPFVAVVPTDVELTPSPEVASAFWVPFSALLERAAWGRGLVQVAGLGDREETVFTHGEHTVWGLTERVLRELVSRLDPP